MKYSHSVIINLIYHTHNYPLIIKTLNINYNLFPKILSAEKLKFHGI